MYTEGMKHDEARQIPLLDLRSTAVRAEEELRNMSTLDFMSSPYDRGGQDMRAGTLEALQTDAAKGYLSFQQTAIEQQPFYGRLVVYGGSVASASAGALLAVEGLAAQSGLLETGGGALAALGVAGFIVAKRAQRQARRQAAT